MPPSLHKYLYAHADPVNKVDPSGLSIVGGYGFTLKRVSLPSVSTIIPNTVTMVRFFVILTLGFIVASDTRGEFIATIDDSTTVGEILQGKQGQIARAPFPKGFPGLDEVRDMTWGEVKARAARNEPGFRALKKLLSRQKENK